jgi:hypothetical protein
MTAAEQCTQFHAWTDDGRWHQVRAWDPDQGTWTIWCHPGPLRLPAENIIDQPSGGPACPDCRACHSNHTTAHANLQQARATIHDIRLQRARLMRRH